MKLKFKAIFLTFSKFLYWEKIQIITIYVMFSLTSFLEKIGTFQNEGEVYLYSGTENFLIFRKN